MKPFAIRINSEQEYKKVKKYAEKWGYSLRERMRHDNLHEYVWFEDYVFNPCHSVGDYSSLSFDLTSNWRKHIRKNTPLSRENVFLKTNNSEHQILQILKSANQPIYHGTEEMMHNSVLSKDYSEIRFDGQVWTGTKGCKKQFLITPKQLRQLLGVKRTKVSVSKHTFTKIYGSLRERYNKLHEQVQSQTTWLNNVSEAIDKINGRITKLEQKELLSQMMQDDEADGLYPPLIPKVAIRVENEQECKQLMRIYSSIGWKSIGNKEPDNAMINWDYPCLIGFNNNFGMLVGNHSGMVIIPFSTIKGL